MALNKLTDLNQVSKKWVNKLSPIFLLLAILWLCWEISRAFWLFLSPIQAPNLPIVPKQTNNSAQNTNSDNFAIFVTPQTEKKEQVNVPPSNIELKGVMVASPESSSSALIAISGKLKNYRINQQLEETSYTLDTLDWNSATLIDPNGGLIVIELNKPFNLDQDYHSSTQNNNQSNTRSNIAPVVNTPANLTSAITNTRQDRNNSVDYALEDAATELEEDPAGYLSKVGVLATGDGYEITDAMSSSMRSRIGLRSGDKIISVNGTDVGHMPANDASLLREIKQSKQATIQVKRGEQIITIRQSF